MTSAIIVDRVEFFRITSVNTEIKSYTKFSTWNENLYAHLFLLTFFILICNELIFKSVTLQRKVQGSSNRTADTDSIISTPDGPQKLCQEQSLSTEPEVSPQYCWVWSKAGGKSKRNVQKGSILFTC